MDYVVGSVAALISGNVTPNRPKKTKKPFTPMKHQTSPNVTPKSESLVDRSIFLSPTLQKKKAIVKKSPKRIFQNPDLDVTKEDETNVSLSSPKADKVKKHLKDQLDANVDQVILSPKSKINISADNVNDENQKKKKKHRNSKSECENLPVAEKSRENEKENVTSNVDAIHNISPKKGKTRSKSVAEIESEIPPISNTEDDKPKSKKKKNNTEETQTRTIVQESTNIQSPKKKNKKKKNKKSISQTNEPLEVNQNAITNKDTEFNQESDHEIESENNDHKNILELKITEISNNEKPKSKKKLNKQNNTEETQTVQVNEMMQSPKKKNKKRNNKKLISESNELSEVNQNAVTNKDSDSEHESDNEIESENEDNDKDQKDIPEDSSDEEKPKKEVVKKETPVTEDEVRRTIFVGNVPLSKKCKKEIKKIFSQYGQIETVRIRTIPVKDARVTPKMAVIKNELHPDRTTVNVYVKFVDEASVNKALAANNTVLNDHHLRVSRSDSTGAAHDPKSSIFVGNIPFALEDEGLRAKFEKCGDIESVRIIRDKKTNAGKGFGYVNFKSKDGVELALALTEEDLTIKNRILRVKRCTQPTQRRTSKPDRKVGNQWQNQGSKFGKGRFTPGEEKIDGAYRRLMNKRKNQDNEGPPSKRQHLNQPQKDKKVRKEFVGMTAEKKKKQKFNKGQKKKKVLSEILTKK